MRRPYAIILLASLVVPPGTLAPARAEVSDADRASMDECLTSARQRGDRHGVCIGRIQDACVRSNASASAQVECAARENAYWDELLNRSYREALANGDASRSEALRALQRQWIGWRNARCAFAATYDRTLSGPAAKNACLAEETARRALELTDMLTVRQYDYPVVTDGQIPAIANRPAPAPAASSATQVAVAPATPPAATTSGQDSGVLLDRAPAWFGAFAPGPAATVTQPVPAPQAAAPAPQPAPATGPELAYAPPEPPPPPAPPPPITAIRVVVDNVQTDGGTVIVAICDKDISRDGCPYHQQVAGTRGTVDTTFKDLPPGRYAVGAIHDLNDNADLDTGAMGIPEEPYALSNGALDKRLIPTFQDAAIDIPKGETTVTLRLRRFGE